ncbi:MAG: AtpZ/AtpI family protein [Planctomycetota bacterium]|nr:AtpZ/AtpI family protein [Planctomycetota bacterium]MDW8373170.1 AtpZ/AtpI family protein [Planctomycetota bacterium]
MPEEARPPAAPRPSAPRPFAGLAAASLPIGGLAVGAGIGWLIDRSAGTLPWWTIALTIAFGIAGLYHMVKEGQR